MALDVKTLVFAAMMSSFFLTATLAFYQRYYKTYPGFSLWCASSVVIFVGYVLFFLRPLLPLPVGVLVANSAFFLGFLLRLDGASRFLRGQPAPRWIYAGIPAMITGLGFFLFVDDDIVARNIIFSALMSAPAIFIARLFFHAKKSQLYTLVASFHVIFVVLVISRAAYWMIQPPEGVYTPQASHLALLAGSFVLDLALSVSFLLLNNQRLEREFFDLIALIPICAWCGNLRDQEGSWMKIENFFRQRSEIKFTHGICPDCKSKYRKKETPEDVPAPT